VAGPPNVGKSSLLNAILGTERAIVTEVPGTTRDHIEVPLSLAGVPILLTDTAGLRETEDPVEAIGVRRASGLIEAADLVVWLGDPTEAPKHPRLIKVHPKADLADAGRAAEGSVRVSARTGLGLKSLLEQIVEVTRDVLPAEGAVALNRRQAGLIEEAAEAIGKAGSQKDVVIAAEQLRAARMAFDRLTGRAGVEDVLEALFGRFCLGK
jgi:tRNA modification GTPase